VSKIAFDEYTTFLHDHFDEDLFFMTLYFDFFTLYFDQNEKRHEAELVKLQNEPYSKRFNLLVHGLLKNHDSAWETKEETIKIFKSF